MGISIVGRLGVFVFISVGLGGSLLVAQIQNPIQAAKDAYKKSKQQQQNPSQTQQPQPEAQSQPPAQAQPAAAAGTALAGDCCSAGAMKAIASSLSFLDLLGAKLGMTPEQAFAAIKASDPTLKIDVLNSRLEPGDAPQTFKRVPQFAVAHTVGAVANSFRRADGSSDEVVLEFSTPPNAPMVIKITREVIFAQNKPVVVANLVDALRKKYGKEITREGHMYWLFDPAGKPITTEVTGPQTACLNTSALDGLGDGMPGPDFQRDSPIGIDLSTTTGSRFERQPICRNLTIAMSPNLAVLAPTDQKNNLIVTIESPALMYASRKNTHDWLQAQRDAMLKKQQDAASQRSAPKL
jgi:hypothetical protein